MREKYAIDACSLINAAKNYSFKKITFNPIWEKVADMIEEGTLISTIEVRDELKDDDLVEWCKHHSSLFLPLTEDVQKKVVDILQEFPTMIKMKSISNSNADPFLIATALIEGATIVSDERFGDESSGDFRIPNICKKYGIDCITLNGFMDRVLE